jgi:S-(hydroxymethyl)glutathione dehydrogenase/alcohol dehydrogenase
MKAAVLHEVNKPLVIEDVGVQKPGPREVLIRTACAGLCHSDLHFMEGLYPHPLPAVLGHESAGIVEQVGSDVTYVKKGDHVVTCLSVFCGTCEQCTSGRPAICTNTEVKLLPGVSKRMTWNKTGPIHQFLNMSSFAEQMLVHENAIVKIREDMPVPAQNSKNQESVESSATQSYRHRHAHASVRPRFPALVPGS